jgi:hypothetical protein
MEGGLSVYGKVFQSLGPGGGSLPGSLGRGMGWAVSESLGREGRGGYLCVMLRLPGDVATCQNLQPGVCCLSLFGGFVSGQQHI